MSLLNIGSVCAKRRVDPPVTCASSETHQFSNCSLNYSTPPRGLNISGEVGFLQSTKFKYQNWQARNEILLNRETSNTGNTNTTPPTVQLNFNSRGLFLTQFLANPRLSSLKQRLAERCAEEAGQTTPAVYRSQVTQIVTKSDQANQYRHGWYYLCLTAHKAI